MDPSTLMDAATTMGESANTLMDSSSLLTSFTDQGQNLAGIFFQASLLPYLLFLYFLSFRANQVPALGNFGFQFVLLFVISTIPSGIISKSVYGFSLADTDYLHGGAELLLTVANVLIVLGFKEAMTKQEQVPLGKPRAIAFSLFAAFAAICATGPKLFADGHTPFLFGVGGFPSDQVTRFPWVNHVEPINALSIPTWAIHFSSVFEYVFAMGLVWEFAKTTGNERWKGLTWGMLPLHASGICACTYHFFYNPPALQFLVTSQAGLTLLGNITLMIAAFRIAQSNGWTPQELIPFTDKDTNPYGLVADGLANKPLVLKQEAQSTTDLALTLAAATIFTSYFVKYGELAIDLPFTPNPPAALSIILGVPALTAYYFYNKSQEAGEWDPMASLPKFSMPGQASKDGEEAPALSMADIKKYGVSGTLAYVLTELAFWLVAFPVAAVALYKSSGHWPDVINDTTDRAAVLAFIFAGANIARAFVPLRLGAALALAPWVDENILNREGSQEDDTTTVDIKSSTVVEDVTPIAPPQPPSAPNEEKQKPIVELSATIEEEEELAVPPALVVEEDEIVAETVMQAVEEQQPATRTEANGADETSEEKPAAVPFFATDSTSSS